MLSQRGRAPCAEARQRPPHGAVAGARPGAESPEQKQARPELWGCACLAALLPSNVFAELHLGGCGWTQHQALARSPHARRGLLPGPRPQPRPLAALIKKGGHSPSILQLILTSVPAGSKRADGGKCVCAEH